ncbi:hypothetical protein O0J71_05920 [Stenotrophomonas sp. Sm3119]|nr:hypothetical protein [Stenotrophomonas sp. Sm3119]MDQ7306467.1 hypothetical protein [Stenotrophomonas sp. Sm3119]
MKKNQTFVDRSDQDVILIGEITIETQGRGMGSEPVGIGLFEMGVISED